jgi:tRNA-dependent cyclodipeptide synthase
MSPGNTYFREDTIALLLKGCAEHFSRAVVFIPAASARHTFAALGYSEAQAAAKARLKGNNLRHRCERVAQAHGVKLEFVEWDTHVISATDYAEAQQKIAELYERSPEFKRSVQEATRGVLEGRLPRNTLAEAGIKRGAQYLLEELAFLEACPQLLRVPRAAYVYHRRWPVFENFIEGAFDGQRRADVGFILAAVAGG